jgi:hypothetical protein
MTEDKRTATLLGTLRDLADQTMEARPPDRIERELRAQLRRKRLAKYPWWLAAAAALVLAGFWAATRQGGQAMEQAAVAPAVIQLPVVEPAPAVDEAVEAIPVARPAVVRASRKSRPNELSGQLSPLTPWYYSEGLPAPAQGQIVFIRVNPQTARRFGVVSDSPVPAQLLIGDDGLTRAIRFVR